MAENEIKESELPEGAIYARRSGDSTCLATHMNLDKLVEAMGNRITNVEQKKVSKYTANLTTLIVGSLIGALLILQTANISWMRDDFKGVVLTIHSIDKDFKEYIEEQSMIRTIQIGVVKEKELTRIAIDNIRIELEKIKSKLPNP